jgi:glycerol-1-phosphate dehydrogenase [NAD(P)+]
MVYERLDALLGGEISGCSCGKTHRLTTREVALQAGAIKLLPEIAAHCFRQGQTLCVADANTWKVAGQQAVELLRNSGCQITAYRADHNDGLAVHADEKAVDDLTAAINGAKAEALLAVGSGTINDIAKSAATAVGCPLVTVATAASMNGYPSAISALTRSGIKTTEPCTPPLAIIADPQILASAPQAMTGAGFGDLLSKNAATADWLLSRTLHDEYFCPLSAQVADEAVRRCIANAEAIRANQPPGLAILAEALVRSGIAMVIAGSSAPASGGEHLMSHLWDMTAHWQGRTPALHGQQTGVTTLISLKLYEKILALDQAAVQTLALQAPPAEDEAAFEARMRTAFKDISAAVLPFARQKYLNAPALNDRRKCIIERWEEIRRVVATVIISSETSRAHLTAAGAVFRAADLGLSSQAIEFAYRHARWIRNRYTILDLVDELGLLAPWQTEVLGVV